MAFRRVGLVTKATPSFNINENKSVKNIPENEAVTIRTGN